MLIHPIRSPGPPCPGGHLGLLFKLDTSVHSTPYSIATSHDTPCHIMRFGLEPIFLVPANFISVFQHRPESFPRHGRHAGRETCSSPRSILYTLSNSPFSSRRRIPCGKEIGGELDPTVLRDNLRIVPEDHRKEKGLANFRVSIHRACTTLPNVIRQITEKAKKAYPYTEYIRRRISCMELSPRANDNFCLGLLRSPFWLLHIST